MHTEWELHQCILTSIGGKMKLKDAMEEFGISKFTHKTYADKLAKSLGFTTRKEVRQKHNESKLTMTKIKEVLQKIRKLKPERKAYLTADEEALVIAAAEMKGLGMCIPAGCKKETGITA
jgi:hypothetical protein